MQVIWKRLYRATSGSDHGTLYQLRNLVQRRNVRKEPKKDFNAHHDFFNVVLTSHILAAAMEIFGMDSLEDEPCEGLIPKGIDKMSKVEKKEVLQYIVGLIVDSYIDINHCLSGDKVSKIEDDDDCDEMSKSMSEDDDNAESSKNQEDDNSIEMSTTEDTQTSTSEDGVKKSKGKSKGDSDNVKMYAEEVLSLGMIYSEYSDAIREGDGERVMRCWKFLLLIFKAAQRKNYACEAFNLLSQHKFVLSPRLSQQLMWSRFINAHGGAGNNVPADLHMEHLNRVLKDGIKGLGANKTDRAITRLGKCINSIDDVLNTFDEDHQVRHTSGYHTEASAKKDIEVIMEELTKKVRPFSHSKGRCHKQVKITRGLMKTLKKETFHSWMDDKWTNLLAGLL